jgi:hypothetical protein
MVNAVYGVVFPVGTLDEDLCDELDYIHKWDLLGAYAHPLTHSKCDELTKDVVLFTIRTKISKLTLCEKHMREAVIATTETGIEARRVGLTYG